jgi:hypothetical protein
LSESTPASTVGVEEDGVVGDDWCAHGRRRRCWRMERAGSGSLTASGAASSGSLPASGAVVRASVKQRSEMGKGRRREGASVITKGPLVPVGGSNRD